MESISLVTSTSNKILASSCTGSLAGINRRPTAVVRHLNYPLKGSVQTTKTTFLRVNQWGFEFFDHLGFTLFSLTIIPDRLVKLATIIGSNSLSHSTTFPYPSISVVISQAAGQLMYQGFMCFIVEVFRGMGFTNIHQANWICEYQLRFPVSIALHGSYHCIQNFFHLLPVCVRFLGSRWWQQSDWELRLELKSAIIV